MPPPFIIRPPSPSSPPLSHDAFDPQPIIRPFPPNYPQSTSLIQHTGPFSAIDTTPGSVRQAQHRDNSSFSSHFALVTPPASSTPPDVLTRAQANVKDCPHRGDLLGYRRVPNNDTEAMELDTPATEPAMVNAPGSSSSARTATPHAIVNPASSLLDDLPYPMYESSFNDDSTARLPQRRLAALPFRSRTEARPTGALPVQQDLSPETQANEAFNGYLSSPSQHASQTNAGPFGSFGAGQRDRGISASDPFPPVHSPARPTAVPVPIPIIPQRGSEAGGNAGPQSGVALNRRYANYPNDSGDEADIFNPYAIPWGRPQGRSDPSYPSVPPPRPSRNADRVSDQRDHDRIDFSPQGLGRRHRTEADWPADLNRPPVDHRTHSQQHSERHTERLERLDALRTRTDAYDGAFRFRPWVDSSDGTAPLHATSVSSRQSRYPIDESRDLRSRLGVSAVGAEGSEPAPEIGRWNRNMQDAIGRRMTEESQSPTSAARRHWEISHLYPRPRPGVFDNLLPYPQPTRATGLWGEIPAVQTESTSPSASRPSAASGQREPWRSSRTLELRLRVFNNHHDEFFSDHEEDFGGNDGHVSPDVRDWRHFQRLQEVATSPYMAFHGGMDQGHYQVRPPAPHELLGHMRLTADMDPAERLRAARTVAAGIGRWPMRCRRKAAEQMVELLPWARLQGSPEMEKDTYCSICHDEVPRI